MNVLTCTYIPVCGIVDQETVIVESKVAFIWSMVYVVLFPDDHFQAFNCHTRLPFFVLFFFLSTLLSVIRMR